MSSDKHVPLYSPINHPDRSPRNESHPNPDNTRRCLTWFVAIAATGLFVYLIVALRLLDGNTASKSDFEAAVQRLSSLELAFDNFKNGYVYERNSMNAAIQENINAIVGMDTIQSKHTQDIVTLGNQQVEICEKLLGKGDCWQ